MKQELIIRPPVDPKRIKKFVEDTLAAATIPDSKMLTINLNPLFDEIPKTPDIKIAITALAWTKILTLVLHSDKEIAWHGFIVEKDGRLVISDIVVYPQTVTGATVDANEKEYTEWIMSFKENVNSIRMQGHSHVNMGTSPSATDISYYNELVRQVQDYYLFMIINKRGDIHWRFYDKRTNILSTELTYEIYAYNEFFSLDDWVKTQMKQITEYKYTYTPPAIATERIKTHGYDQIHHSQYDYGD